MILYHGTTKEAGLKILSVGFKPDLRYNWNIKSKTGYVYLSRAYAPFYAMMAKSRMTYRCLIKVSVDLKYLYPEDDFIMNVLGKPTYTQQDLDRVNIEEYKHLARASLKHMGNACARPEHIKVIGISVFDAKHLILVCDPVVSPMNYLILGNYYRELTEWIYDGRPPEQFTLNHHHFLITGKS